MKKKTNENASHQQLGVRWAQRAKNEPIVDRNRFHAVNTYGVILKLLFSIARALVFSFFFE